MFFRLVLMPSTAFVIPLRSTSPRPALNPSVNRSFNSFSLVINLSSTGFNLSSVSVAASTIFSLRPLPEAPPAPPEPPESLPSFFVSECISSIDKRPPYSFAAFFADCPAASVASPTPPIETAAESAASPMPLTVVVVLVFFPVSLATILLNASVTVRILANS